MRRAAALFFFPFGTVRKLDRKRNTGLTVTHGGNILNMANSDTFPGNMATWELIGLTVTDGGLDEEQSELVGPEPSIQTSACRQCQNKEEGSK